MDKFEFIATSTFGLESVVKREIIDLGFENIKTSDGAISFTSNISAVPKANIWLRSADRVLVVIGRFKAETFEELFENTKALPWSDWIPKNGNFTVSGKSVKSKLFSIPDCQSIVEKAVVESLKKKYNVNWFEKNGAKYKIQVSILKDTAILTLDTTGPSLNKRGYRQSSVTAPLKETLAHALIALSFWKKDRILLDPVCGSGTIPIETALKAKNIAPGILRKFVSENWDIIPQKLWKEERKNAYGKIDVNLKLEIYASDIDSKAIENAKHNASLAGVDDCIYFKVQPFEEIKLMDDYGICICNPPYAERVGTINEIEKLYRQMGNKFNKNKTWSVYVITSCEEFEKLYGRKADKKRKLFNGNIKTDYYQFFGTRP